VPGIRVSSLEAFGGNTTEGIGEGRSNAERPLVGPGGPASSAGGSELRHLGELVFNYFSGEGQRH
jgi:hypothetical protein